MPLKCQGCLEDLTSENRKENRQHRLSNRYANELCDSCLEAFILRGKLGRSSNL